MVGSKETDTNELHDRDIETTVKETQHIIECRKDDWVESEKSYIYGDVLELKNIIIKQKITLKFLNLIYQ